MSTDHIFFLSMAFCLAWFGGTVWAFDYHNTGSDDDPWIGRSPGGMAMIAVAPILIGLFILGWNT